MASRLCCVVLLLACAAVSVSASRQLLQSTSCPVGCNNAAGGCIFDSSANSYKCTQCQGSLVVNAVTGTCDVPPGRYADLSSVTATDCPKGSFCAGGVYVGYGSPNYTDCAVTYNSGVGLTTIGKRATSKKACVNEPGYSYAVVASGDPSATPCPVNTYGPGLRKQRACTPCAPGYTTDGADTRTNATACGVPAGYFLKAPGQVAPCPMGEYKDTWAASTSCTKCKAGVTTLATAQTSATACNQLVPGYYAKTIAGTSHEITLTAKCPQKYWCPGGQPSVAFDPASPIADSTTTVTQCANGAWTQGLGSTSVSQCLTPPGYKTFGSTTDPCGSGKYRAEWTTPSAAGSCSSCGVGISAALVDQITSYNISTEAPTSVDVAGSAGACYINAGQGMYYSAAEKVFRAVSCATDNYGVANTTYGLAANPCRDCPANMITDQGQSPGLGLYDSTGAGFTSPLACVTKPGFGYNGRSSYQCRAGTYNPGNNYAACTACGEGLTTNATAAQQKSSADCMIAIGYGNSSGLIQPCPVGYYNDATHIDMTTACTQCGTGLSTSGTGSTASDQCNICLAGYGDGSCATQCGGTHGANYGVAGVLATEASCTACPSMTAGFAFDYNGTKQDYQAAPIARAGASVASDCLAGFAQIQDVAWYLRTTLTPVTAPATNFSTCVGTCDDTCMFVTFNYTDSSCSTYAAPSGGGNGGTLAFKAVSYGDTAASKLVKGKAMASGSYTFWKDTDITKMTDTTTTPLSLLAANVGDCLAACDALDTCAGVTMPVTTPTGTGNTFTPGAAGCKLITGDTTLNTWVRTLTHAVASKLTL